jgi:hypothetical protein
MASPELEEFGKLLVEHVRDAAIQSCDRRRRPDARGAVAARWQKAGGEGGAALASTLIPDCVDEAIFYLLNALDQGLIELRFSTRDGKEVALHEDGELAGWYTMTEGWVAKYSQERFVDDFADFDPEDG